MSKQEDGGVRNWITPEPTETTADLDRAREIAYHEGCLFMVQNIDYAGLSAASMRRLTDKIVSALIAHKV